MRVLKRNNVQITGEGTQALLFSHGFGCDQHIWRMVAPSFQEHYRVILFDHVGAGQSDTTAYYRAKYDSLQGYASDVLEICQELSLEKVVFVGHSVSAIIGILAAIREPALFDKLILIGPSPYYLNDGSYQGGFTQQDLDGLMEFLENNYLGWSSTMAPIIVGNPERPELGEALTNNFCRIHPDIAQHFARVTFLSDHRADLPLLKVDSLILQCFEDCIAPLSVGQYVHQQLKNSSLAILQAIGHCPHLSAPQETIATIKQYLNRQLV
jgi:sigma-B regulation protein RsbQ